VGRQPGPQLYCSLPKVRGPGGRAACSRAASCCRIGLLCVPLLREIRTTDACIDRPPPTHPPTHALPCLALPCLALQRQRHHHSGPHPVLLPRAPGADLRAVPRPTLQGPPQVSVLACLGCSAAWLLPGWRSAVCCLAAAPTVACLPARLPADPHLPPPSASIAFSGSGTRCSGSWWRRWGG
jgi:hypothetical protein